jgi:hypothetical protein
MAGAAFTEPLTALVSASSSEHHRLHDGGLGGFGMR